MTRLRCLDCQGEATKFEDYHAGRLGTILPSLAPATRS
jgi:hypothetical protein